MSENYEDFASFVEALTARKGTLSKRLKQVAQYFLNNPDDVAIYNIVELAKLADVPTATLTRFSKEMGFSGFSSMQNLFRQRLVGPRMTYADRIAAINSSAKIGTDGELDLEQPGRMFDTFIGTAMDSLLRVRDDVSDDSLVDFIADLSAGDAIHIAAARGAYSIGAFMYYGLSTIGKPAHLLDNVGAMRAEQLNSVGKNDIVLVLTFGDYTSETVEIAKKAAETNRKVLAITDNELSPVTGFAEASLFVKEAQLGHFRSQVPTLVLCQTLIVGVSRQMIGDQT
ncbi:MAG: MurR/RpiR family transcriptional regulator [Rhizobiaceae bacterium]